jgi:hypothetical protein
MFSIIDITYYSSVAISLGRRLVTFIFMTTIETVYLNSILKDTIDV